MDIARFTANLDEARRTALIVVTAKNNISRNIASDSLDASIENMAKELNIITIHEYAQHLKLNKIDKDALLKSLLEDAEEQSQWST